MAWDVERAIATEWLVTDGLGGYAMGTVGGLPTRSYHALLVVARRPPVDRTVLVAGVEEWIAPRGGGALRELSTRERPDGSMVGLGVRSIADARLDGRRPVVVFDTDGLILDKRIWMAQGHPTTYVRYALLDGAEAIDLELRLLLTERDHHAVAGPSEHRAPAGLHAFVAGRPVALDIAGVERLRLREEAARGLPAETEVLRTVPTRVHLRQGEPVTLVLSADPGPNVAGDEPGGPGGPEAALAAARRRDTDLLDRASTVGALDTPFARRLVLAADAFVVRRQIPSVPDGRTVIAGYPWFNDWGRDTMIALPGLCLATGRSEEAATILRTFAAFARDGLVPNDFPDDPAAQPALHTIDASLWFVQAVAATVAATRDEALLAALLPTVRSIVEHHLAGTRFGIGVDPADGLLRGGADGVQLTWMDAKVDGWVVTPRRGKPVEIQALWIGALRHLARWSGEDRYAAAAARAETSFRARFWRPDLGYLADVVDGPAGDDLALRPNQLLALSLPHPLVDVRTGRSILASVRRALAVPLGLRSLAPSDPAYRPVFQGDRLARDAAYHQGTVWTWLIGAYADAVARFDGGPAAARAVLAPFERHLDEAGLGSISEILEPEPPFTPRGCPFQAWAVAEVLRAWRAHGGT